MLFPITDVNEKILYTPGGNYNKQQRLYEPAMLVPPLFLGPLFQGFFFGGGGSAKFKSRSVLAHASSQLRSLC